MSLPKPYLERDGITLYHGDAREILPLIKANVMVTDPPYGIAYRSNGGPDGFAPWRGTQIANDESTDARDAILETWGDRPALVFGEWKHPIERAAQALVWDKGSRSGMGNLAIPWRPNWELIFVIGRGFKGSRTSGVLSFENVGTVTQGRLHPNEKPVRLIAELLRKCPPGSVVDPFAGSGTTLEVARDMGRKAVGIEIEERWCELIAKRLSQGVLFA